MKKTLLLLLLFLFTETIIAQQNILSDNTEISVLTIGSGASLNDAFGHNAFRIQDPTINLDITFDYGRFDFEAPQCALSYTLW